MNLARDISDEELDKIVKSSVQENDSKKQWELWAVWADGSKELVGVCSYRAGQTTLDIMVEERAYLVEAWEQGELTNPIFEGIDLEAFQGDSPVVSMYIN